jgi:isopropylmalate/homocitrate/citramalate synthase
MRSCAPKKSASPRPTSCSASTRAATRCASEQGYGLSDEQLEAPFHDFKSLADMKKEVYEDDLAFLVERSSST